MKSVALVFPKFCRTFISVGPGNPAVIATRLSRAHDDSSRGKRGSSLSHLPFDQAAISCCSVFETAGWTEYGPLHGPGIPELPPVSTFQPLTDCSSAHTRLFGSEQYGAPSCAVLREVPRISYPCYTFQGLGGLER